MAQNHKKILLEIDWDCILNFSFYATFNLKNYLNYEYFYLLFVISLCIATDVGGYIFWKNFKGSKIDHNKS